MNWDAVSALAEVAGVAATALPLVFLALQIRENTAALRASVFHQKTDSWAGQCALCYESGAIVEYIIARHSDGALKPAVGSPAFPQYLQWFHYCEGMLMPPINTIIVQTVLLPPERRNEEALSQAQRLVRKVLEPINDALADGRPYIAGAFSGADIMLGHATFMSRRLGRAEGLEHVNAYVQRLEARPAFKIGISA